MRAATAVEAATTVEAAHADPAAGREGMANGRSDDDTRWRAVQQRVAALDGTFFYAVRTTGVYCRPSCPSRRPRRENVRFYDRAADAERAGYRPCRRCEPQAQTPTEPHLALIVAVCRYLEEPHETPPTLEHLAARFAMSPTHLQRSFTRIVGVSPRRYADAHRRTRLKARLKDAHSVTEALHDVGYGSSSSFYGKTGGALGMAPLAYRAGGEAMRIAYMVVPCRLGQLLVAATSRGVCAISLGDAEADLVAGLGREFPRAALLPAGDSAQAGDPGMWVGALLAYLDGERTTPAVPLDIQATAFQRRVWDALRAIPYGGTRSYRQVAESLGQPGAARAVARACATNPVALAIPCHRVVREDGAPSGYRWGRERKEKLLAQEARPT